MFMNTTKERIADGVVTSTNAGDYSEISDEDDIGYVSLVEQLCQLAVTPMQSPRFIGQAR